MCSLSHSIDEGEIQVDIYAQNVFYQPGPSPAGFALECVCSSVDVSVVRMAGSISVSPPLSLPAYD